MSSARLRQRVAKTPDGRGGIRGSWMHACIHGGQNWMRKRSARTVLAAVVLTALVAFGVGAAVGCWFVVGVAALAWPLWALGSWVGARECTLTEVGLTDTRRTVVGS